MADNISIKDSTGTTKVVSAKDLSSVFIPRHVQVDEASNVTPAADSAARALYARLSDGTTAQAFVDADAALDERTDHYMPTVSALFAFDSAASAGAKTVPLAVESTAQPNLRVAHWNAGNAMPAGDNVARPIHVRVGDGTTNIALQDVDGAIDERTDHYVPTAAALMATDAAGSAGAKLVPIQCVSTAVPNLRVAHYNGTDATPAGNSVANAIYMAKAMLADNGLTTSTKLAQSGTIAEVKDTAGTIYSITVTNSHSAAQFVQVFNAADGAVTVGTTAPDLVIEVPAGDVRHLDWANGLRMGTGISLAATTGRRNATTATADTMDIVISYK